ncbi:WASL protein, partial [Amia calva]|nr:WASL protein [Amia calva]
MKPNVHLFLFLLLLPLQTLSSAVVQVYASERNAVWSKKCCGVACLVKDNPLRSYFIRIFDIKEGKTMWEQELYNNFSYSFSRPYFLSFVGDACQVGLNFASEEEAKRFRSAVGDLLGRRQRRTEKRRDPPNGSRPVFCPLGPALPMATVDIKNPEITNMRYSNSQHAPNNILHPNLVKDKKKVKGKKKKLTKADIGTPSNFQHIGHVGWDPNTGFDLNNLDPELKNLFDMCGISEAQLKDKETSKVIYDFIEKKGGVEAVKNELRRQGRRCRQACPKTKWFDLVKSWAYLRLNTSLFVSHNACVPRSVLETVEGNTELQGTQSPLGGKSALLDQIREGTQLKKVEQNNRPVSNVGRDALLDQIRQGIQLKTVADGPDSAPSTPGPTAGIVGALMEVMQKRSKAIHSSGRCPGS